MTKYEYLLKVLDHPDVQQYGAQSPEGAELLAFVKQSADHVAAFETIATLVVAAQGPRVLTTFLQVAVEIGRILSRLNITRDDTKESVA